MIKTSLPAWALFEEWELGPGARFRIVSGLSRALDSGGAAMDTFESFEA